MKNLLLDTNIIIGLIRSTDLAQSLSVLNPNGTLMYISVATLGELKSIATYNKWGDKKLHILEYLLKDVVQIIDISKILVDLYVEIDTFSQCKNPRFTTYSHQSARNMGKNDLWIAATASFLGLTLVTTDKDFEHLNGTFLSLHLV